MKRITAFVSLLCIPTLALFACGNAEAPDPFGFGGAGGSGGGGTFEPFDAGPDADPTLGGPCIDDGQCDDAIPCTLDRCDPDLKRCRFSPDDSKCQDGRYCNGLEQCNVKSGCTSGEPIACDDMNTCTIDTCDEAT